MTIFCIALAAAVFGLLFDSLLGATLERRGWLNNDAVNFLSTAGAAVFALGLVPFTPIEAADSRGTSIADASANSIAQNLVRDALETRVTRPPPHVGLGDVSTSSPSAAQIA